jgi:Domain of unknown function (DUF4398)
MRRFTAVLPVFAVLGLLSCGPTKSTTALIQANMAIRHAEELDAKKKHPYELTLAHEYYVKAKEEAGYSQFEVSEKLALQSVEYARVAAGEATPTPTPDEEEQDEATKGMVP